MQRLVEHQPFFVGAFAVAAVTGATAVLFATGQLGSRPIAKLSSGGVETPDLPPPAADPTPAFELEEEEESLPPLEDAGRTAPPDAAISEETFAEATEELVPIEADAPDAAATLVEEPIAEEAVEEEPIACGPATCPAGYVCCNASCGVCVPPGERCSQRPCNMPMTANSPSCGPITCNVGEVCCDARCGRCVRPDQPCDSRPCLNPIEVPFSEQCGMSTCNVGMVCCNPSCGICAPPGAECSKRVCS